MRTKNEIMFCPHLQWASSIAAIFSGTTTCCSPVLIQVVRNCLLIRNITYQSQLAPYSLGSILWAGNNTLFITTSFCSNCSAAYVFKHVHFSIHACMVTYNICVQNLFYVLLPLSILQSLIFHSVLGDQHCSYFFTWVCIHLLVLPIYTFPQQYMGSCIPLPMNVDLFHFLVVSGL